MKEVNNVCLLPLLSGQRVSARDCAARPASTPADQASGCRNHDMGKVPAAPAARCDGAMVVAVWVSWTDSALGSMKSNGAGEPIAVRVLLPVHEMVHRLDVQRTSRDRGAAMRRWTKPDDLGAETGRSHRYRVARGNTT